LRSEDQFAVQGWVGGVFVGLVVPMLRAAAVLEVFLTPRVALWVLVEG